MCGIAGLMTADAGQVPADILRRLGDALSHRGPDGRREYQAGGVGLVHTRLAIIDVAGGAQPLLAERGLGQRPCALIANAEIYNDLDLRAAMPDARFATGSDCESALHVYLRHGHRFADRLRGMYAIAIHDPAYAGGRSYLVLARDPFGIKPLYYAETARGFAFASEPRALVDAGLVAPVLRREGRDELLALQFTTGRDTPFVGIHRVLPGETLVVEKGRIVNRLRRDALPAGGPAGWNADEAERRLAAALADSVAR
ncbi:MAG: asparagine synthetase B, partial [Alphaproteobacteria bacterium]|nr:asparagine synthetase B [Alphaproteobacteria bacterium]